MTSQVALQWPFRPFRRTQWSAVCTVSPCSRKASTIFLAIWVLPVPGKPVSSRLSPFRQWLIQGPLHARLPILPPQPGHLLVAIDCRAVPVRHLQQPLHGGHPQPRAPGAREPAADPRQRLQRSGHAGRHGLTRGRPEERVRLPTSSVRASPLPPSWRPPGSGASASC